MGRYRMIAMDLDGTLLQDDGTLSTYTRSVLEAGIRNGIHMVVASGRAFATLPEEIRTFPGIEYAITSNGAAVYKVVTGECVHAYKMKPENVRDIVRIAAEELGTPLYEVFIDGNAYAPADYVKDPATYGPISEKSIRYIKKTRNPVENIEAFIEEHAADLDSLDVVLSDQVKKKKLWRRLEQEVKGIYITASVERFLEMSDEKSGKVSGMRYLMKKLGIKQEETMAFGNADNDAAMLAFAGLGAAVKGASEACCQAADIICDSNNDDGPAKVIAQYI